MENLMKATSHKSVLLMREGSCLRGEPVEYELRCLPNENTRYVLSVTYRAEMCTVFAGSSLEEAQILFRRFFCGLVTPCTAQDVAADFWWERRQIAEK